MTARQLVAPKEAPARVQRERTLTAFDLAALVFGAVVGADVYVAASLTMPMVGAVSLLLWVVAGAAAFVIALNFSACARLHPKEGGAYAYTCEAFGERAGFLVGWSILLAEVLGAAVFPASFAQYVGGVFPRLGVAGVVALKVAFVGAVLVANLVPAKGASRLGAIVGFLKLAPLALVVALALLFLGRDPAAAASHFEPFVAGGPLAFANAFVVIFWAYTGFEVATMPASEVREPRRSIPLAIAAGLAVSLLTYLAVSTALLVILPQPAIGATSAPLVAAARDALLQLAPRAAPVAAGFLAVGALLAILGAEQASMLGASRLVHALGEDGHLPAQLAKLSPRGVPTRALLLLAALALGAATAGGLAFLIGATVFFVAVTFVATAASAWRLSRMDAVRGERLVVLPIAGLVVAGAILLACGPVAILVGAALLALGAPLLLRRGPRRDLRSLRIAMERRHPSVRRVHDVSRGLFAALAWRAATRRQARALRRR
jgi:APA family basic amino acid/polyamine antiporter